MGGQPFVANQTVVQAEHVGTPRSRHVEQRVGPGAVDADLPRAGPPQGAQLHFGGRPLLGLSRLEGRNLGGLGRALPAGLQHPEDLGTPSREVVDPLARHPGQVSVAVDNRPPLDPQRAGQLVAKMGLVEEPGRLRMGEKRPGIEGAPHTVVDGLGEVGNQHVGVQQRIVRP